MPVPSVLTPILHPLYFSYCVTSSIPVLIRFDYQQCIMRANSRCTCLCNQSCVQRLRHHRPYVRSVLCVCSYVLLCVYVSTTCVDFASYETNQSRVEASEHNFQCACPPHIKTPFIVHCVLLLLLLLVAASRMNYLSIGRVISRYVMRMCLYATSKHVCPSRVCLYVRMYLGCEYITWAEKPFFLDSPLLSLRSFLARFLNGNIKNLI